MLIVYNISYKYIVLSINVMKSYFYNSSIPILNATLDEQSDFNPFFIVFII